MSGDHVGKNVNPTWTLPLSTRLVMNIEQECGKQWLKNNRLWRKRDNEQEIFSDLLELLLEYDPGCGLHENSAPEDFMGVVNSLADYCFGGLARQSAKIAAMELQLHAFECDLKLMVGERCEVENWDAKKDLLEEILAEQTVDVDRLQEAVNKLETEIMKLENIN